MRRPKAIRAAAAAGVLAFSAIGVAHPAVADSMPTSPAQPAAPAQADSTPELASASEASISSDGRWVVYSGVVDGRSTVFRTDREEGETTELSPVPESVRRGDTIHPRLSADGCVIVAITEIAFDLFRDDDRDERWDVYRLVVPECGGQPNGWELVSASERTGTALDGVFTESAPALSGSGAVVAYVHQLAGAAEGVGTISIVDITVPVNEPGRVQMVAGMPVELPNRAYLYGGASQPALSQNGRHLAFVSDATSSDPLPGWADGPVLGGPATAQVYVWDRYALDQRSAVHLVSGRNGQRSDAGADSPAMSEDGRVIVFVSRDRTLVPATLPPCVGECASQIYRFDRDTDGNGIFDEPPRKLPLSLVSAIDAGVVDIGVPRAGNQSSWGPAVNADGSQIAFVTDATNLLPSRRAGGGGRADGDLLVAEHQLGQIRRVLDGADATGVPGAHSRPALSKTGQTIVFDTMALRVMSGHTPVTTRGLRNIVTVDVAPQLSLASLDFGTVLLGFESAELYATVRNAGPAAFEPTLVRSSSSNFRITGGTCVRGVIVAAGTSCSVNLTFNPTEPRSFSSTLTVLGNGADAPSVTTTLRGAAGEPTLLADPGGVELDAGVVRGQGGRIAIDIDNIGFLPTSVARIRLGGEHPDDFEITTQSCLNRALNPDASCTVEVEFQPTGAGYRSALLIATTPTGQYTAAVLGGFARYEPTFDAQRDVVSPGSELGVGGSGFPGNSRVSIGFDDGSDPFTVVESDDSGNFLAIITIPARLRAGQRLLVASAENGAVGTWAVEVEARVSRYIPRVPGFGVG